MTLKQFIEQNQVTAFQIVPNVLILNAVVDQADYAIDVDTSGVPFGTQLQTFTEFTIENDILTVDNLTLNTAETNMLASEDGDQQ